METLKLSEASRSLAEYASELDDAPRTQTTRKKRAPG
jgi:hypothetical protein